MKASPVNRFVSALIDGVILVVVNFVLGLIGSVDNSGTLSAVMSCVSVLVSVGYFVYFWTSSGQTVGKKVMGLKVVSVGGGNIDIVHAILRYIGYFISSIFLLGFIWIFIDKDGQGWHDKIAGTKVVSAK